MAKKQRKHYSPDFKFSVVLEVLTSTADATEIARKHGVHPMTLLNWKTHFHDHGAAVFARTQQKGTHQQNIVRLEQMLGCKEVELALAMNSRTKS